MVTLQWIVVGIAASFLCLQQCDAVYYGTKIGDFANRFHQVKGEVYAVDSRTLFIKVKNLGQFLNWVLLNILIIKSGFQIVDFFFEILTRKK